MRAFLLPAALVLVLSLSGISPSLSAGGPGSGSTCGDTSGLGILPSSEVEISIQHLSSGGAFHAFSPVVVSVDGAYFVALGPHPPGTKICRNREAFAFTGATTSVLAEKVGPIDGVVIVEIWNDGVLKATQGFIGTGPECKEWILDPGKG